MLKGKKTYILGAVTIISAAASYLVGDITLIDALNLAIPAAIGMTVRNSIPKFGGFN